MAAEEVTAFLANTSFFGGLSPEVVGVVAGMLKEKRVSRAGDAKRKGAVASLRR